MIKPDGNPPGFLFVKKRSEKPEKPFHTFAYSKKIMLLYPINLK